MVGIRRGSIATTISSFIDEDLQRVETKQEVEAAAEFTPFQLDFWRPSNILTVEDTPFSNRFLVQLLVISFSVAGNLCRMSMQDLTLYNNSFINYSGGTVLWANFTACFVMSWTNNAVKFWHLILEDSGKSSMKQIALHSGITSGFCGSFSTFSSMMIEIFFKTIDLVNNDQLPNDGYRVMEFFGTIIVHVGIPLFGHLCGSHFALLFDYLITPRIKGVLRYTTIRIVEFACVFIGVAAIIANLVLTCTLPIDNWYKQKYSFAILMGAFGALMRFKLSILNGIIRPWFPLGTLIANISGVLLISICELLLLGLDSKGSQLITNSTDLFIIKGFASGWAGSLTTISSFINELYNLDYPMYQHVYFWSTFIPSLIIIILIDGTYNWTRGMIKV